MAQRMSDIKQVREKSEAHRKLTVLLQGIEKAVRHGRELDPEQPCPEPGSQLEFRRIRNLDVFLKRVAIDVTSIEDGADGSLDQVRRSRVSEGVVEAI